MPKEKPPTKTRIAKALGEKIHAHFERIEPDRKLNPTKKFDKATSTWSIDKTHMGVSDFYNAYARGDRHRVRIVYISYQGHTYLSIEEATRYLAWLDAGNVGHHWGLGRE